MLGLETVPCIVASDLTPEQIKAFRLADNKVGEIAEWDFSKLEAELANIDFDMSLFGFEMSDFEEPIEIIEDDVPDVDEDAEPIVKRGDIWQLGRHRLMCGDATSREDVERLMNGSEADLLLTDPPYNVAYEGGTSDSLTLQNDNMSEDAFSEFLQSAFENADRHLACGGSFYVWHASRTQRVFEECMPWAVRQQLIWNKNSMVLGRQDYQWKHEPCFYGWKEGASHGWYSDRTQTTVLDFPKPNRNGEHPTMKPVELIAYQICNSTEKGDIVLDVFGGSGSTLIAAEQTGRKCLTMELDEKYASVILRRWENLTGEKAYRANVS